MALSRHITKIINHSLWALAGIGVIVLLVAAVNNRSQQVCRGYDIDINGKDAGHWFIDKADIVRVLTANNSVSLRNKKISAFNLYRIETRLKEEVWIRDADLYFDNNGILKVKVDEREPIARIFTSSGESFYIDSTGHRLPLSSKMSARLPVFTGFPVSGKKIRSAADKKLLKQVKEVGEYILNDPFWMAQISQIDITHAREMEMVPTVGNHIIEFGEGDHCQEKFHRLMVFYRQVLAKTGMEKYERIKVQYDQQVIGVKKSDNN